MKIWSLAEAVYGIDLYALWVDSVLGASPVSTLPAPMRQAATVMLGAPYDGIFSPASLGDGALLFEQVLAAASARHGLRLGQLRAGEFGWLAQGTRIVHAVARDNADFVAQATIILDAANADIRDIVATVRERWLTMLLAHHAPPMEIAA